MENIDIDLLIENILSQTQKSSKAAKARYLEKKVSGMLPTPQAEKLKEKFMQYSEGRFKSKGIDNSPKKDKDYISKQSCVRQNLLSEVDIKGINKQPK